MKRKKTYKELEEAYKNIWILIFVLLIFLILFAVLLAVMESSFYEVREENQILQDKLNELNVTWTLKMECFGFEDIDYMYIEQSLSSFEEYKETVDAIMSISEYKKSCEVIE